MADEGDSGEKTEDPSGRRLGEAREQGQVGQSRDLSNVVSMTAAFLALEYCAPALWRDLIIVIKGAFTSRYSTEPITAHVVHQQAVAVVGLLAPEVLLIMGIAAVCGALTTAVQTNFLWSSKLLKPKFSQLNPLKGIKRIFSTQNLTNLLKAIAKLCIIGPISYMAFFDLLPRLMGLMDVPISELMPATAFAASHVFWKIISWLLALAILDLIWQKHTTRKHLKMSKQELKDERKSTDGDETMRRRILAIGLQRARERMLKAVKTADVVVTNPTHLAVALSYSTNANGAPKVVAKGRGHLAARIRELARENKIPIVERKPLARALFKMCEVGDEIPYELFKAVAELLAYVFRLKGKVPVRANAKKKK